MTKRVLGALAALVLGGSALACSSSSGGGVAPGGDTGPKADAVGDTRDSGPRPDSGGTDTSIPFPTPGVTGKPCTTAEECDPEGEMIGYCTNAAFSVGPLNPTPICLLYGEGVCEPSDDMTIRFCDKDGAGVCGEAGMAAECSPKCELTKDGMWKQKCAGKNSCVYEAITTDYTLIGTCQGGCQADADCPSGSKCDPALQYCVHPCTTDANCKAKWTTAPPEWKCNVARGACELQYAKTTGDTCADSKDCLLCFKATAATAGYCSNYCQTGGSAACKTGFTCDHLLDSKDSKGAPAFTFTSNPAGLNGFCLRNCTDASGCTMEEECTASAGMTQKTCRPKSAM